MKPGFYIVSRISENNCDNPLEWMDGGFNGGAHGAYPTKAVAIAALSEIAEVDYNNGWDGAVYGIAEVTVLETESRHVFSIKGEQAPDGEEDI